MYVLTFEAFSRITYTIVDKWKLNPILSDLLWNETESELHFKKRNKRIEEVINLINASSHPQAIKCV